MDNKQQFEARIRQLLAIDRNAVHVYTELAGSTADAQLRAIFLAIAADEKKHVAYSLQILGMLGTK